MGIASRSARVSHVGRLQRYHGSLRRCNCRHHERHDDRLHSVWWRQQRDGHLQFLAQPPEQQRAMDWRQKRWPRLEGARWRDVRPSWVEERHDFWHVELLRAQPRHVLLGLEGLRSANLTSCRLRPLVDVTIIGVLEWQRVTTIDT